MVFSSFPAYLDPSNWHQHQQQQHQQQLHLHHHQQNQGGFHHGINNIHIPGLTNPNPLLPPPPLPPPQPQPQQPRAQPQGSGSMLVPSGSVRPGSMAERARMANIPMPEMALKCPRCESTNTKFCYFNNYSLSQPRHFCKTCRRYWTRGGALRSVPVGGGCRRNKRSKSSSSSKSATAAERSSSSVTSSATSSASVAEMMGPPGLSPLRFMSPLHHLTSDFGEQLGLTSYDGAGFHQHHHQHHLGSMGSSGSELYRMTPPFLGGLLDGAGGSSSTLLYGNPFEAAEFSGPARSKVLLDATESVKAEERGGGEMSLMKRFNMGINTNNDDSQGSIVGGENYNWGSGNAWNDHLSSALNNSSCSNTSAL